MAIERIPQLVYKRRDAEEAGHSVATRHYAADASHSGAAEVRSMVTNGRPQAAGAADAKERRTAKRSANKRPAVDANNSAKERRTARRSAIKRRDVAEG